MKACLSDSVAERPNFEQILGILDDMVGEVATGTYLNARGRYQARSWARFALVGGACSCCLFAVPSEPAA